MNISPEQRKERLRTLPLAQQELYGSLSLARHIKSVREKYSLPEGFDFVNIIGDTLLGFYKLEGMPAVLQEKLGLDETTASKVAREFVEILSEVKTQEDTESQQPQFIPTSVTYGPLGEERPQQTQSAEPAKQEVAAAESAPEEPVQPLRTMEDDMDKIHGYGAYRKMYPDAKGGGQSAESQQAAPDSEEVHQATSQEDMLNKRPPLAGTPSYDQPPQQ